MNINVNYRASQVEKNKIFGSRIRLDWFQTAINLAFDIATYRSEDPYTQVGACAVKKDGFEVGLGYNGPPMGIDIDWKDREKKNEFVLHAEENVLNRVLPGEVSFLAVTHLPCNHCIKTIAQKKISTVVYSIAIPKYFPEKTFKLAEVLSIELILLRPTTKNVPKDLIYIG